MTLSLAICITCLVLGWLLSCGTHNYLVNNPYEALKVLKGRTPFGVGVAVTLSLALLAVGLGAGLVWLWGLV